MVFELAAESGPAAGEVYALPASGRRLLVGRGDQCDIVVLDTELSRVHLAIDGTSDRSGPTVVRDLGSKNGTFVRHPTPEGQLSPKIRLVPRIGHSLEPGARLVLGASVLHYRGPELGSQPSPRSPREAASERPFANAAESDRAAAPSSRAPVESIAALIAWLVLAGAAAALLWLAAW